MAVFVATEATLFGSLIGSYFYLRFQAVHWPPPEVEPPKLTLPLVLTAVLVATALPIAVAVRSAHAGRPGLALAALAAALLVQSAYLGLQLHVFLDDLGTFTPQESSYGSIYFTLLGAHHAHVAVGLLLELWLLLRLAGGVTRYRLVGLRAVAFYWYFVIALAVVVVCTQLSPRV
jgi:heme/copper-type cytochrome/quinol oxidase subunit 3